MNEERAEKALKKQEIRVARQRNKDIKKLRKLDKKLIKAEAKRQRRLKE